MFYPFTPTINEQFTIVFSPDTTTGNIMAGTVAHVSTNGGTYANSTNAVQVVADEGNEFRGSLILTLTAAEMNGNTVSINFNTAANAFYASVTICTVPVQPTNINTNLPNITQFSSFDNPTMQEVLSVIWQGMTNQAAKKNWTFSTFLKKWNF